MSRKISRSQFHGELSKNIYRRFRKKNQAKIKQIAARKQLAESFVDRIIELYLLGGNGSGLDWLGATEKEVQELKQSFDATEQEVLQEQLDALDNR